MSSEVSMTLDEAVAEVLGLLTGLDLTYDPELDRYRSITRQLNRALRANALEAEWSCYTATEVVRASTGDMELHLPPQRRPRINGDDAVRLVDGNGVVVRWAYFLPRDALHKYRSIQDGLWVSSTGSTLTLSRPLNEAEAALELHVPVMREPRLFRLPPPGDAVPARIRNQPVDFPFPDLVIGRAAYLYAQTDPVMQPRAQTLEQEYKGLMYQLIERDTNHTDTPYANEFDLGLQNGLRPMHVPPRHPRSNFF